jgi:hypothetical protein
MDSLQSSSMYCIAAADLFVRDITLIYLRQDSHQIAPNITIKSIALLLCIRKVSGSNLGSEAGYPD